jgi:hypothetical protein
MMTVFDCEMEAWQDRAEAETRGYATELVTFKLTHPMPQLRDFMKGTY